MTISTEKYFTEKELNTIHSQILENRVYKEIHTFAHDLKTPLVTISGLASLLTLSQDKDKVLDYAEHIDSSVEKISNLMSNFLCDNARIQLTFEDLLTYVEKQVAIENGQVLWTMTLEKDLPKVSINIIRVARAFINIIENAIAVATHNDIKEINLCVYAKSNLIVFEIKDNGIGISPNQLDTIWEIKAPLSSTSGLGLTFTRKIIEDHGGQMHIKSQINIGTVVKMTLPIAETPK